ncbi:MAG: hypothetical protein K8F91_03145 [Candidatus Obscuribacterales bacterium]|nr:hypothetical protein [Candidatus Obscuribacterales bacterium]
MTHSQLSESAALGGRLERSVSNKFHSELADENLRTLLAPYDFSQSSAQSLLSPMEIVDSELKTRLSGGRTIGPKPFGKPRE